MSPKYLVDTNILIDHLRGEQGATAFLLPIEEGRARACVSVITEYELLAAAHLTSYQAHEIARLLALMPRLMVTSRVVRVAAECRRHMQLTIADALIAATALVRHATLVTRNVKDFRHIKGLRLHSL